MAISRATGSSGRILGEQYNPEMEVGWPSSEVFKLKEKKAMADLIWCLLIILLCV